nr:hypothetical protein [Clavibacter michiganensis]
MTTPDSHGDAVAVAVLERGGGGLQLVPGGGRLDPRVGEHRLVVEERDGVDGGREAVRLALVGARVDDALRVAVGRDAEVLERGERSRRGDLLQVGVVEHEHVGQRLRRRLLQHLLDEARARDRRALDGDAERLPALREGVADDGVVVALVVVVGDGDGRRIAAGRGSASPAAGAAGEHEGDGGREGGGADEAAAAGGGSRGHRVFSSLRWRWVRALTTP